MCSISVTQGWELQPPLPSQVQGFASFGGGLFEDPSRGDKSRVTEWAVRLAESHDFLICNSARHPPSCVPLELKRDKQTDWVTQAVAPQSRFVWLLPCGGWGQAASRARAEQRKALGENYSNLSTAGAAAVYTTVCTTFPWGLFGDGRAGNLQNGKAALPFSHPQTAEDWEDLTEQIAWVCLEVAHVFGLLFFHSNLWVLATKILCHFAHKSQ